MESGDAPALARGAGLGRFVVLGCVGRGAMGEVYAAYDPDLDRKIAIKLVRADRFGGSVESRTRLMREAQATAKVSHPNVVVVYDAGTTDDRVFIAMEFLEGHTLRYWLQERQRAWPEIMETFVAAGRGLAAAHERDLVHRDFKPDNVMVGVGGQVRVMDFGLARVAADTAAPAAQSARHALVIGAAEVDVDSTALVGGGGTAAPPAKGRSVLDAKLTQTGALLGTPAYMAAEQFDGRAADARSDQFSFCVALWEAIYGARPFAGKGVAELQASVMAGQITPPPAGSAAPVWVRHALERGLARRPEDRFPSMSALIAELDRRPNAGRGGFASQAAAKLEGIWEAPVGGRPVDTLGKAAMREAFLATGKSYAETAFVGASAVLDRYARRWTELYVDVCEATHVRGEQSSEVLDLRMECLLEGLADLKALCRLLRTATAEVVENAVSAATALGTLERCEDVELLRAVVRVPDDPTVRGAVGELRARLTEARALVRVGRHRDGLDRTSELVDDARRIAYGPTLAEALLLRGELEADLLPADDLVRANALVRSMEEAVWTAELARHDEVAAEAAQCMIVMADYSEDRFGLAETWCRHAEMLLRRMGGHDVLWGWYHNNVSILRLRQGRLAAAVESARLALAAKERALGVDAADVGITLTNLVNYLLMLDEPAQALDLSQRAVRIARSGLSDDHPKTAIAFTNHAECLFRVGQFQQAREFAQRATMVFERQGEPDGLIVSYPMLLVGLTLLAVGNAEEAIPVLERTARIRDARETDRARLAEVHFALGRALHEAGVDRDRGLALVRRAREEYAPVPGTLLVDRERHNISAWLAARDDLSTSER